MVTLNIGNVVAPHTHIIKRFQYFDVFECISALEEDGTASQLCSEEDYRHLRWLKSQLYLQDTLKYLCRAAIRGYLGLSGDISGAIETLQLPKALKYFLNLNDFSEEI